MKHKWPMLGPFTSLDSDLQQVFESHGIDLTAYNVQPRHGDDVDALWTIEGRHIGLQEQREDLVEDDQQFAVIAFPVDSHEEFEELRRENRRPDENWYYVNNQNEIVRELDSPIQKLQKLASKDEKQSAEEAAEIVKETLTELQAIRKRRSLYDDNEPGSKPSNTVSGEQLLDQATEDEEDDN